MHTIISETGLGGKNFIATERNIAFAKVHEKRGRDANKHKNMVEDAIDGNNDENYSFNPVWVKAAYGICLNAICEPE